MQSNPLSLSEKILAIVLLTILTPIAIGLGVVIAIGLVLIGLILLSYDYVKEKRMDVTRRKK